MSPMDKLDEAAEIGKQLHQLRDEIDKATASSDWAGVNKLQAKTADLMERKEAVLSSVDQ